MLASRLCRSRFFHLRQCHHSANPIPTSLTICGKTYLTDEWTNVTARILSLVGRNVHKSQNSPLALVAAGIREHFNEFDHLDFESPVVTVYDNFDSLLIPKDHVSRKKSDTYYVNAEHLLRCHTSAHQAHCLQSGSRAFTCISEVFRRDAIDSTHYPIFHQSEVFKLFKPEELGLKDVLQTSGQRTDEHQECHLPQAAKKVSDDLKSAIESYVKHLLGSELQTRWVSAYFPFTHPSYELEILWQGKWLEILGCGVVEQKLLTNNSIDGQIGWAFGLGLERIAMLKYQIPDIRLFWSTDPGFTNQFKNLTPWDNYTLKPISKFPVNINDISFWLPSDRDYDSNDFYDLVRTIAGDLVEQVELVDEFKNPKTKRTSHCYRIRYRSHERTLPQEEVNVIHKEIENSAARQLNVQVR